MFMLLCMINDVLYLVCMFILIFEFMERLLVILKLICIDDRERESLINVYVFCCNIFVCICNINDII